MKDELKACPFCGRDEPKAKSEPRVDYHKKYVLCERCQCQGPSSLQMGTAITAWNTRNATRPPPVSKDKVISEAEAECLEHSTAIDICAEDDIVKTTKNTMFCQCGRIFNNQDDFDTLGSDSGMCCPDCGIEEFQTVTNLLSKLGEEQALNKELAEHYDSIMLADGVKDRYHKCKDCNGPVENSLCCASCGSNVTD